MSRLGERPLARNHHLCRQQGRESALFTGNLHGQTTAEFKAILHRLGSKPHLLPGGMGRVHIEYILASAYARAYAKYDFGCNARELGMLMTVDGTCDQLIDLQGLGHVTFTDADGRGVGGGSEDGDDDEEEEEEEEGDGGGDEDEFTDDEEEGE